MKLTRWYVEEQIIWYRITICAGIRIPLAAKPNQQVDGDRPNETQRKCKAEVLYQNLAGRQTCHKTD